MRFPRPRTVRSSLWLLAGLLAAALQPQVAAAQCGAMFSTSDRNVHLGVTNSVVRPTDNMKVGGTFVLPTSNFADLNPLVNGARVVVQDGQGSTVIDQVLPPGAYDRTTRIGWVQSGDKTHWHFRNSNFDKGATNGIFAFVLIDESDQQPKQVAVRVLGRRGDYSVDSTIALPFKATVTVDNTTSDCGATDFADTDCTGHTSPAVNRVACVIPSL